MDFLKAQLSRMQQQIGALSASQRMLAAALVVIMVMTLYWWVTYAGRSDMEPVLDQSMSPADIRAITLRLKALGIPYAVQGDRVLVPTERQIEALADLSFSRLLPEDKSTGLDDLVLKSSPLNSSRRDEKLWNEYKQAKLSEIIGRWPQVRRAWVFIDPRIERGLNPIEPKATVNIMLQSGDKADLKKMANSAADFLSGAVANLSPGRVTVIINGVSQIVRDRDDPLRGSGGDWLDELREIERMYLEKLALKFSYIEGVLPSVQVKLNRERKETDTYTVDPKNAFQKEVSTETTTEETRTAQGAPGEAGVTPNSAMSLNESHGAENTSGITEKNRSEFAVDKGTRREKVMHPGGDHTVVSADVSVPRSYFLRVYREINGGSDPDAAVLGDFIKVRLAGIKETVKATVGLASDEAVHVDAYPDVTPVLAGGGTQAAGVSVPLVLGNHLKEIALGVLALVSLFLVSSIVRKTAPAPTNAFPTAAPKPPQPLPSGEEPIGEASDGHTLLDGMELDEESVKAQQMVSQVSQLVEENPDAAANLVKRWLNHS